MITLIVMIFGTVSLTNLSTDLFPSINIPIAAVSTIYFGASPEEIENLVTQPLESQLATVNNVDSMTSVSSEHSSLIIVQFVDGVDMDSVMMDMRDKLDLASAMLPEDVQDPMVIKFDPNMMPIMAYSVSQQDKSMSEVTRFVDNVLVPRIESIEGVAAVSRMGGSKEEVVINLDSEKLKVLSTFGLNKNAISGMLTAQNLILPSGSITEDNKDYSIRASGKFDSVEDLEDLVLVEMDFPVIENPQTGQPMDLFQLMTLAEQYPELLGGFDLKTMLSGDRAIPAMGGSDITPNPNAETPTMPEMEMAPMQIKLSDIGTIEFQETKSLDYAKVNGEESISISIQKQTNVNTSEISKAIQEEVKMIQDEYPGSNMLITLDQGKFIDRATSSVAVNGLIGGILAVLILFIFLKDIRPTIIIGVSIPVSVIAAFTALWLADITLNIVSMGGLALGIGMLVDNSVVVLENIYRLRKEGVSRTEAAITGAKEVSGAIVASTLTTIAVFMPVMFVKGLTAEIFQEMAIVVTITLLASLIVAISLVPMLSSKLIKRPDTSTHHKAMDGARNFYSKVLKWSLHNRLAIIIITLVLFLGSILGISQLGMELMPASDEGQVSVTVTMPKGTTFKETVGEVAKVEEILKELVDVDVISASVNGGAGFMSAFLGGGADSGSISVILVPVEDRSMTTDQVADEIRRLVEGQTLAEQISVEALSSNGMMGGFGSSPISVEVSGMDFEVLEALALEVTELVQSVEGTTEVDDGIEIGAPEINILLKPEAALAKGIMTPAVASTLNEMITGVASTSISMNGRKVPIYINETANGTLQIADLPDVTVTSMTGEKVSLGEIADIEEGVGYTAINRQNQRRTLTVSAKLLDDYDSGSVGNDVNELIREMTIPEGYSVALTGEYDEIRDSFRSLGLSLLLGIVLIYMIMASQFESFKYPFVILFSIPLAFTGSFIGLFITGTPLSITSVLGFLVLSGIVVNNGIVLVDYINRLKDSGRGSMAAILEAGPVRLRPILMTALTTILALLPSAIGIGEGAEMMRPLGISVVGGLIMSTFLTLVVVPVVYYTIDRKGRMADQEEKLTAVEV